MLKGEHLSVSHGKKVILDDVGFSVEPGQWLMIVGPNGAGKSTLVGALGQDLTYRGRIELDGEDLHRMRPYQRAKRMGVLMQTHGVGYAFTVEEVVRLGRFARTHGLFQKSEEGDEAALNRALSMTGLTERREQSVLTLSGGELQRTFLAELICQDPDWMILDEPTNHLDPVYIQQVFGLLDAWRREPGRAIVSVVHDLGLARAFGTHGLLLDRGRVAAFGPIAEVLTKENLNRVYDMNLTEWMRKTAAPW